MVGIWTVGFMPPIPYPPTGPGSLSWPLPPGPIPSGYSMGYEFLFPLPGGVGLGSGGIRGGGEGGAHCSYRRYFSSQGRCIAAVLLCTGGGLLSLVNIKSTHTPLPN